MNSQKKIFIVEDEAVIVLTLEATLKRLGYRVAGTASSGEECLEQLTKMRPDLILMDIHLEGDMDGIEVAGRIKAQYGIPVIFLTAFSNDDFIARAKIASPFGYIVKPFQERELYTTIEISLYKHENEYKLAESEKKYRELAESIEQIIIELDSKGKILFLNQKGAELLGLDVAACTGTSFYELFPGTKEAKHFRAHLQAKLAGTPRAGVSNAVLIRNKWQRILHLEEYLNPVTTEKGLPRFRGVLVDVSARKQKNGFDQLLEEIRPALKMGNGIEKTAGRLCKMLQQQTSADKVSFTKYDPENQTITTYSSAFARPLVRKPEKNLAEYLLEKNKEAVFLKGTDILAFHKQTELPLLGAPGKCWIGIPIMRNERVYGILSFQSDAYEHFFSAKDFRLFRYFGKELSLAIDDAAMDHHINVSRINHQTILETINEGLLETDIRTRKIVYINENLCRLLEYHPEELLGMNVRFLFGTRKEQLRLLPQTMRDLRRGISGTNEFMVLTKSGKPKWFIVSAAPVKSPQGQINLSVSLWLDITGKKETELALQKSEASKNAIIQASPDALLIIAKDGSILDVYNKPGIAIFPLKKDIRGENIDRFLDGGQKKSIRARYNRVFRTGEICLFEIEKKSSTQVKWYEVRMARISNAKVLLLMRDISDSKAFQSQLKKFYNTIEQSEEMILITDKSGRIEYVNPMFCRVTGYLPEEIIMKQPSMMKSGKHNKKFYADFWNTILDGKSFSGEFTNKKKNNELFIEEKSVTPLFNEKGEISNYISIGRDVTERKKNERELNAYARLKYFHEKKEAKIRTLSLVLGQEKERKRIARELHDGLGQMLTATKMNLEHIISPDMLLKAKAEDVDKVHGLVIETIHEVRRISNDLSPSGLHDFGLLSAVNTMLSRLQEFNRRTRFELRSTMEGVRFRQDIEINLFRIIQESLNNAIKHSDATKIEVLLNYADSHLEIRVQDNGKGADLAKLSNKEGNNGGQGLKNIKDRADLIGGKISIDTAPNKGFQVQFQFQIRSIKNGKNFIG